MSRAVIRAAVAAALLAVPAVLAAQATVDLPAVLPAAVIDLRTSDGAALANAQWRYSDARIVATLAEWHIPASSPLMMSSLSVAL